MNTSINKQLFLFALVALGFACTANAQRGSREGSFRGFNRNAGNRSGSFSREPFTNRQSDISFNNQRAREVFSRQPATSAPVRQFSNTGNRDVVSSREFHQQRFDNNVISQRSFDRVPNSPRVNTFNRPQTQRSVAVYNNRVVNNYRYAPVYNYAPRRYVYVGAPRYSVLPHGFLSIQFGGYPYYYHSGLFFGFNAGFYEPVFAPIGIHIGILPVGYHPFWIGPRRYYYYDGVYYRNYLDRDNEYEVVDAPMGAQVSALPKGATTAVINGEKFYEFNGTYYKEGIDSKNKVVYTVAGKYGRVNNTDESNDTSALRTGDVVTTLPDGCKEVTINGEELYVSPDSTYYKSQTADGATTYKIVGTGSKQ